MSTVKAKAISPQILSLADEFPQDEQEAIARFAGVTTDHYAFRPLLAMSQLYGLSPLLGEIWLLETDVFDRDAGTWTTELRPAVGRDGFLKVLSRDDNVITPARGNVVCANDFFETEDDGEQIKITHKVSLKMDGMPSDSSALLEAERRGPILGAWAKLFYRDGRPPFYFYAPLSEYGKRGMVGQDGAEPAEDWLGAWVYTSAMILKCGQSYVYRVGGGITGVVPADEIPRGGTIEAASISGGRREAPASDNAAVVEGLDLSEDTKRRLIVSLERVNELSPFSWATAKVSVMLQGADEETAKKVLAEIDAEISRLESASQVRSA